MDRYVAFLRGMNLGGRRITNDELRAHFEALGCDDVATFRASGNVIFDRDEAVAALTSRLESGLAELLGYEVPVFLRTAQEVRAIATRRPFDAEQLEASAGKLQVALLLESPSPRAEKEVLAMSTDEDRLAIVGRELYWLPRGGMSDSELDLKAIATSLGPTTIRTKGTIDQIATKHFSD
jgi:uncharacterized protein (DUF1697 family)